MNTEKKDIFQRVTEQIVSAIEDGAGSYRMPEEVETLIGADERGSSAGAPRPRLLGEDSRKF